MSEPCLSVVKAAPVKKSEHSFISGLRLFCSTCFFFVDAACSEKDSGHMSAPCLSCVKAVPILVLAMCGSFCKTRARSESDLF